MRNEHRLPSAPAAAEAERNPEPPRTVAACPPSWRAALAGEILRIAPTAPVAGELRQGWFAVPGPAAEARRPLAFAQQVLPDASLHQALSVREAAAAAVREIAARLPKEGPWRLEVVRAYDCPFVRPGRPKLVAAAIRAGLRPALRRRLADALAADSARVQVGLMGTDGLAVSVLAPDQRREWRAAVSPCPAGIFVGEDLPDAPSRAYRKLLEAEAHGEFAIAAGETCVDLGGSPGGWSYVALARGAAATLVDRTAPRADLLGHPCMTFVKGDAFRYAPPAPVDWLLCDVIAFPQRTLELLDTWLARGWCRRFVATFKFRGAADYGTLEEAKDVLARRAADGRLRRLLANRNEAMAFGTR